jgi:DNA polymerase-3 subunit alpha
MVTQFDMDALEILNLVKFDFLKLRTLDTIQVCADMIYEQLGITIDPYSWPDEYYRDNIVWETLSEGDTLGVFQIETNSGTRLTKEFKPQNLNEMSDILTLVRPGPQRSGLTRTYMRRRAGEEDIEVPDPRLKDVLAKSYGCLLYQEDIMATTMVLAGYDGEEADKVRKILGKKQVEKVIEEGKKFVAGAEEHGMVRTAADDLWEQMAEFAKYSFNRAHAYAYGMISYWCAWLKVNYPVQFLVACMSTVDDDRIPEFINAARKTGYKVLPPDINASGKHFRYSGDLVIRYGFMAIRGIADASADPIIAGQPYQTFDDFNERRTSKVNSGAVKTLARVGAFDSLFPNRKALVTKLDWEASGEDVKCIFKDPEFTNVEFNGLPCHFDWASEPQPPAEIGRNGKPKKQKVLAVPKRCSIKCRNYTPPDPIDVSSVMNYTPDDIMAIEQELLGIYLTYTPFDRVDEKYRRLSRTASEMLSDETEPKDHAVLGVVKSTNYRTTSTGSPMAHVTLDARDGDLATAIFSDGVEKYRNVLKPGKLVMAIVKKRQDGRMNITAVMPL